MLGRKEFINIKMNDIHFNWEDCIGSGSFKKRRAVSWSPPPGVLKFNVDGELQEESRVQLE